MFFNETILTDRERQRGVKRRRPTLLYSLAESLFLATSRGHGHFKLVEISMQLAFPRLAKCFPHGVHRLYPPKMCPAAVHHFPLH